MARTAKVWAICYFGVTGTHGVRFPFTLSDMHHFNAVLVSNWQSSLSGNSMQNGILCSCANGSICGQAAVSPVNRLHIQW